MTSTGVRTVIERQLTGVGRVVLAVVGRDATPETARAVGRVLCVALPLGVVHPVAGVAGAVVTWYLPRRSAQRRRRDHERWVLASLPEAVDLVHLAVSAGCTVPQALEALARTGGGPVAGTATVVVRRIRSGTRTDEALGAFAELGPWPARLGDALAASARSGVALAPALARLGEEVRDVRRRDAEDRARRMPVLLLFPLVLCILPAFALLSVIPLIVVSLRSLQL